MTSKPPAETDPPGGPAPRDGEALRAPVETPYAQTSPPAEADPPPVAGATADSYAFAAPMLVLLFLTGICVAVSGRSIGSPEACEMFETQGPVSGRRIDGGGS